MAARIRSITSPGEATGRRSLTGARHAAGLPLLIAAAVVLLPSASAGANPAPVGLGTAGAFSVLAGSTVTNTGNTVISNDAGVGGDLGVSPGSAVTGFPPGTLSGTIHAADATASTAKDDAQTAFNSAAGRTPDVIFAGVHDLVGQTLTAGVYNDASALSLSGALTLNGQGDPDSVFIFQAGSTLITSTGSSVVLTNGAQACNVFWQIGSSATLGTSTAFNGTILAAASISLGDAVNVQGRLLAGTGAVTLINDSIHTPACAPIVGVSAAPLIGSTSRTVTVAAFLVGAAVLVVRRRRRPAVNR